MHGKTMQVVVTGEAAGHIVYVSSSCPYELYMPKFRFDEEVEAGRIIILRDYRVKAIMADAQVPRGNNPCLS